MPSSSADRQRFQSSTSKSPGMAGSVTLMISMFPEQKQTLQFRIRTGKSQLLLCDFDEQGARAEDMTKKFAAALTVNSSLTQRKQLSADDLTIQQTGAFRARKKRGTDCL
jgi:hypothetical protein